MWALGRQLGSAVAVAFAVAAALAAPASAASATDSVALPVARPASQTEPPPGFATSAREAIAIASRVSEVRKAYRDYPGLQSEALVWDGSRWEVNFNQGGVCRVEVDVGPAGGIEAVWTGLQAQAYFARGHFGGTFDNPIVWLTFGLLFLLPFLDPRRPLRRLHWDLLALLGFGVSYAFFNQGRVDASVSTVYPVLLYLLVRMLAIGFGRTRASGRAVPLAPTSLLLVGLVLLVGARIALNVTSDKVIDVGYASVVGADRVAHGRELYVANDVHGDTYGPLAYVAYIPFEAVFPWKGEWDDVPAAHAAAITFDVLTILALLMIGGRMRAGPEGLRLGLALAWAWAAFPFTLFGLMQNTNDGLIAMLLAFSMLALTSPLGRGALLGAGAAAKFFPGALVALYARGLGERNRRAAAATVASMGAIAVASFVLFIPPGGLREIWDCTLGFQLGRSPDLSLWGIQSGIDWTQKLLEAAALLLTLGVAVYPRGRRTLVQVAALGAAVTIALQVPAGHWFYLYIPWFMPFALVALLAREQEA